MTTSPGNASHHCTLPPRHQCGPDTRSRLMQLGMQLRVTVLSGLHRFFFVVLCVFLLPAVALADEFDDLRSSAQTKDITPQERKYFTEALDKFPKRWLRADFYAISLARWLDDEHVVFTTRRYPGWEAAENEPSRIIVLHVDSGELIDSGYRGDLACLNHKRELMIRQIADRSKGYGYSKDDRWLIGTWGQPLQEIKRESGTFIPNYLCRFAPYGDPIYTTHRETLPPDAHRIFPLLPEHGVLKETVEIENREIVHPVSLIKPDGTQVRLKMGMPMAGSFYYQPWEGTYFSSRVSRNPSLTVYPSGEISRHPPPHLLRFWDLANASASSAYGTRMGILWSVSTVSGRWGKQGLFLQTQTALLKIEDGQSLEAAVSPNGCRILSFVTQGDPYAHQRRPWGEIVIDVCKQGKRQ